MNLFRPKTIVVVKPALALSEAQLNTALAVGSDTPLWRALLQLIDTAVENANDNASAPDVSWMQMAGYVGGAAHLRMLREELVNRRENGLQLVEAGGGEEAMEE